MKTIVRMGRWLAIVLSCWSAAVAARNFPLPAPDDALFGQTQWAEVRPGDTLLDVARRHGVGQEEMQLANPTVDRWLPAEGQRVLIPSQYLLPGRLRDGLLLNLPEMRVYYFPPPADGEAARVDTYPVSIGRMDWNTPLGGTRVVAKQRNPSWRPPESVKKEAAAEGREVPDVVPPGPDNPLGSYALRLGLPGYLIHGTNKPYGVGMRVTHGCVRLLPEDIEQLFEQVPVGTRVHILNEPVKTSWHDDVLYVEVHPPLDEDPVSQQDLLRFTLEQVYGELEQRTAVLDAPALRKAVEEKRGIPVAVTKPGLPGMWIGNPLFR